MPIAPARILALWLCLAAAAGSAAALAAHGTARLADRTSVRLADAIAAARSGAPEVGGRATKPDLSAALRERLQYLTETDPLMLHGISLLDPALLATFYAARDFAPLWHVGHGSGRATVTELLDAIDAAGEHGLDPEAYHAALLDALRQDPAAVADLELLATDAFLRHALHRAHGRLTPGDVDPEWHLFVNEADPAALLGQLAAGVPPAFLLDGLWPSATEYWRLIEEKRRLVARSGRGTPNPPPVSGGPLIRPGDQGPRVIELRARLGVPPAEELHYDQGLEAAVRQFQQDEGLTVDGIVGQNTLELLNITDASRIARIDINLERWRWLMRDLPPTRVQVDVSGYALRVIEDEREVLRMNVIVGTPFRRTPVFSESMRYLVFNPYWNVPRRIAIEDKLPLLQADAADLAAKGYEARFAREGEPDLPVDAIDWSTITPRTFNFLLRQRPGENNALGRVKFILPNPFSVYLHDTPARDLFARSGRAFSSGCIRLENAMLLAGWLLRDQPQWTQERIDRVLAMGEPVEVPLVRPVPVLVLYFTAVAGDSGKVFYRPDMYGRDQAIAAALLAASAPATALALRATPVPGAGPAPGGGPMPVAGPASSAQ